jgi:uncharacterized protein with NRDE domain
MCSVVIRLENGPEPSLWLAANRDENLDRASAPSQLRDFGGTRVLAPVDLVAGGTWIGVNEFGLLVAITNRFMEGGRTDLRSRGELVKTALRFESVESAGGWMKSIDPRDYNPFHLIAADLTGISLLVGRHDVPEIHHFGEGVVAVTERSFSCHEDLRVDYLSRKIVEAKHLSDMKAAMSEQRSMDFGVPKIYVPEINYGSRSSWLLKLGASNELWITEKPPQRDGYENFSESLDALFA